MDIGKIERDIEGMGELKDRDQKLETARKLKKEVADAERECANDFSISFDIVKRVRALIPIIEGHVSRLEAGARRRGA